MSLKKQKSINVSVSKIINWPQSSASIKFQIAFFSKVNGQMIISKSITGKYNKNQRTINLNYYLKINYQDDQHSVILRLSYGMGFGGQIIIGDYIVNLQNLKKKKQFKLPFGQNKNQFLLIQQHKPLQKSNVEQQYGMKSICESDNQQFIRQRQQFLQRHSNRSQTSSNRSTSNNFFSNKVSQLLSQVKNIRNDQISHNKYSSRNIINSNVGYNGVSEPYIRSNRSQVKNYYRSGHNKYGRQNSQNNSQRNSESRSSQKYVLFVNNLNIVPCQEYYETKIKQITSASKNKKQRENKSKKTSGQRYLNQQTNSNIYTAKQLNRKQQKAKQVQMARRIQSQYY